MSKINLKHYLLFLIFPLIYLSAQVFMKLNTGYFFISDFDPTYAFLLNGLSLAEGNLGSGLAGFPGATMQTYIAIVIHIGYLFSDGKSLVTDVLQNPEYYLGIAAVGIGVIHTTVFYITGLILYRNTGRYDVSLILQLTPFVSVFGFSYGIFIMCEPFLMLATQIVMLQAALLYFTGQNYFTKQQLIINGIAAAFGMATKIIFAPVFLLLLFIIKGGKNRMHFLLAFAIALGFFLIPVYPDISGFFSWLKLILFHTRLYGDGDAGIIDPQFFTGNIQVIVTENPVLFLALSGLLIFHLLQLFKKLRKQIDKNDHRFLNAITIVMALGIIMFSKHYKPYYMGFFHGLSLLPLIVFIHVFKNIIFKTSFKINAFGSCLLVFLSGFILMLFLFVKLDDKVERRNQFRNEVSEIRSVVRESPRMIIFHYGSTAFEEGGFNFGLDFSHRRQNTYRELLHQHYPVTWFYSTYDSRIMDWQTDFSLAEILSLHPTIYIFNRYGPDTIPRNLSEEINKLINKGFISSLTKVFPEGESFGYLYKIERDTFLYSNMLIQKDTIRCSCETITGDGLFIESDTKRRFFDKAFMLTRTEAFTGRSSVKLTPEMSFALDIRIEASANDMIRANAWRKTGDKKGFIVLDAHSDNIYKASGTVVETSNGWEKVSFSFRLPQSFRGNEVHLYLWYNGSGACYFDDFEIVRLSWINWVSNMSPG